MLWGKEKYLLNSLYATYTNFQTLWQFWQLLKPPEVLSIGGCNIVWCLFLQLSNLWLPLIYLTWIWEAIKTWPVFFCEFQTIIHRLHKLSACRYSRLWLQSRHRMLFIWLSDALKMPNFLCGNLFFVSELLWYFLRCFSQCSVTAAVRLKNLLIFLISHIPKSFNFIWQLLNVFSLKSLYSCDLKFCECLVPAFDIFSN